MRLARTLSSLALCSAVTLDLSAQAPATSTKSLTELAGRAIPGLEAIGIADVQVGTDYFSGTVPALAIPGQTGVVRITGFKVPNATQFAVVISLPDFFIGSYIPALNGTGLENIGFRGARFVIAPPGSAGATVSPPSAVAAIAGASLTLPATPGIQGGVDLGGQLAEWFGNIGLPIKGLPISGSLPTGLFTKSISAAQVAQALYPLLDLTIAVPAQMLNSAPALIPNTRLTAMSLHVDGKSGSPAFSLAGTINLADNRAVTISAKAGGTQQAAVQLTATNFNVADLIGVSVPGLNALAITGVTLSADAIEADLKLGTINARAQAFKAGNARGVALSADSIKFSNLVAAAAGTPLDDFVIRKPTWIYTQTAQANVSLPADVRARLGAGAPASLPGGLGVTGQSSFAGGIGQLLSGIGMPSGITLPTNISLDPSIFGKPPAMPDVDLSFPVGALGQLLPASVATIGSGTLRIAHKGGATTVGVAADGSVTIEGKKVDFAFNFSTGSASGAAFVNVKGTAKRDWEQAFGVDWLTIKGMTVDARIGQSGSFSISGTGNLPSINGLTASLATTYDASGIKSGSLSLTGAEIPVAAIPGLGTVRGVDQVVLKDLLVSNTAIAGSARLKSQASWLETIIFKSAAPVAGWNVALLYTDFALTDFFPAAPAMVKELLGPVKFKKAALLLSQSGISGNVTALPQAAQVKFGEIYGPTPGTLSIPTGVGLIAAVDPAGNPSISKLLSHAGAGSGPLPVGGTISGIFGGPIAFDISANLPTVKLPDTYAFLGVPSKLTSGFHIKVDAKGPALAVQIGGSFPVPRSGGGVATSVDGTLSLALDADGISGEMSATTTLPWVNTLGIAGFTLEPQSMFDLRVSVDSRVDLKITGNTKMGKKMVSVTGAASVVGGVLASGALGGRVNEVTMSDVMALTNAIVSAGGGAPITTNFPDAKLDSVAVGFATPGTPLTEYGIGIGGGVHLAGRVWLIFPDAPLGAIDGTVEPTGIALKGKLHDFTAGPVSMKGNNFDLLAKLGTTPPHFIANGGAMIEGIGANVELAAVGSRVTVSSTGEFKGANFSYNFAAYFDGPPTLSPSQLTNVDFGLDATLNLGHLQQYMVNSGAAAARKALGNVTADLTAATDSLDKAKKALAVLTDSVTKYEKIAGSNKQTVDQALTSAQLAVAAAKGDVDRLARNIKDCNDKIGSCNQTKRVCTWYDVIKKECTSHKEVPDLVARAKCETRNAKYGIELAGYKAEKEIADLGLRAANRSLRLLQQGVDSIPLDADPRVAPWVLLRDGANVGVTAAQDIVNGLASAATAVNSAVTALQSGSNAIKFQKAHIQGSLKQLENKQPVILDVTFTAGGRTMTTRIPFSPTNLAYSLDAFETFALEGLYTIALADPNVPAAIKQAAHEAYISKRATMDSVIEAIGGANAVPDFTPNSQGARAVEPVTNSGDPAVEQAKLDSAAAAASQAKLDSASAAYRQQLVVKINAQIGKLEARAASLRVGSRPQTVSERTRTDASPVAGSAGDVQKLEAQILELKAERDSIVNRTDGSKPSSVFELEAESEPVVAALGKRQVAFRPRENESAGGLHAHLQTGVLVESRAHDRVVRAEFVVPPPLDRQPHRPFRD